MSPGANFQSASSSELVPSSPPLQTSMVWNGSSTSPIILGAGGAPIAICSPAMRGMGTRMGRARARLLGIVGSRSETGAGYACSRLDPTLRAMITTPCSVHPDPNRLLAADLPHMIYGWYGTAVASRY